MRNLVLTISLAVGLLLSMAASANAVNYARAWARASATGNFEAMNRIMVDARNPYSSLRGQSLYRNDNYQFYYRRPVEIHSRQAHSNLAQPRVYRFKAFDHQGRFLGWRQIKVYGR